MNPNPSNYFEVTKDSTSLLAIVYNRDQQRYECCQINDPQLMQKITDVIIEHKMYKYKRSYINKHVLDGDGWGFYALFHDETSTTDTYDEDRISSGGSNAYPNDDGLKVISKVFYEAYKDATFLYVCDREGEKIPSVTREVAEGERGDADFIYVNVNPHSQKASINLIDKDNSEIFAQRFKDVKVADHYVTITMKSKKCFGARLLDDGENYTLCLIVNDGKIETLPLTEIFKGNGETTHASIETGMKDVCLCDGKICGITEADEVVEITWEEIKW